MIQDGYEILNNYFDKIFVITIKNSIREGRIQKRLQGLNFEFFYGVDGTTIDKQYFESKGSKLTYGQIGCSLSHVNLYKKIYDENIDTCLVIEDDCNFNHNLLNFESFFKSLPHNWDLIYIGYLPASNIRTTNFNNYLFRIEPMIEVFGGVNRCVVGTQSIGITKDFAQKMYEFNKDCLYTADGALTAYVKLNDFNNMFAFYPSMSTQDNIECLSVNVDTKMIELTGSHINYRENIKI
jgi:glycosyl transferase family 25